LRATAEGCILERAMNDISALPEEAYGLGFVPARFLGAGEDEYRIRDEQLAGIGRSPGSYRPLRPYELETLVKNGNTSPDWGKVLVSAYFTPELVKNSEFAGLVRLGRLAPLVLEHHDLRVPVGITRSRIIACDIGDDCAVHDCSYLAHYIIGDGCILMSNDEIQASNHVKFGNGVVMEGEPEEVRVQLDLMNEAGGRSVLPFEDMTCADAYLWARRRGDSRLMEAFKAMTDASFDRRRGRYGTVGRSSVLKSNCIIKDAAIGECAYVKGANKIKNVTIRSSEAERTQIGEGVELVNGIVGYGCRVFYGSKAVRFVMGPNSALKYGARLIHSVLGDNSTVSCCEILNNLIFPAHEQHHNTSFLIASLVRGQSNMAAGATIGSNHNSRSNDGEIEAGRGFWPGLSTSVKHSSRFASYCLLSKGDYRFELDIPLPFCLVDDDRSRDRLVLVPAYWWSHNLYALMRNESKFLSRDKRVQKIQSVEFSPFAPDTAEEIIAAVGLLEEWCGTGKLDGIEELPGIEIPASRNENSSRPVLVVKPRANRLSRNASLVRRTRSPRLGRVRGSGALRRSARRKSRRGSCSNAPARAPAPAPAGARARVSSQGRRMGEPRRPARSPRESGSPRREDRSRRDSRLAGRSCGVCPVGPRVPPRQGAPCLCLPALPLPRPGSAPRPPPRSPGPPRPPRRPRRGGNPLEQAKGPRESLPPGHLPLGRGGRGRDGQAGGQCLRQTHQGGHGRASGALRATLNATERLAFEVPMP
jgi:NDP-sugar pyrophosphorylase family protein